MTLHTLISRAAERTLTRPDIEGFCAEQGILFTSWLVAHAHAVACRFVAHELTWDESSSALNCVWPTIASENELTPYFFDVFRAFEDAEILETESARDSFSRRRIREERLISDADFKNA
jgi:hypothetical protein